MECLLNRNLLADKVKEWLKEDVNGFDVAGALVGDGHAKGQIICKQSSVFCGKPFVDVLFTELDCKVKWYFEDGNKLEQGKVVADVYGAARNILLGERTALNVITRASGIATVTREFVDLVSRAGSAVRVAGTRKTTPGFRLVEKYAILVGGGDPHRYDLTSMIMLKDNHIDLFKHKLGAITNMINEARSLGGFALKIEVETRTEQEAVEAAQAAADIVMLDNFKPKEAQKAAMSVKGVNRNCLVEVSGGVTRNNIMKYLLLEPDKGNDAGNVHQDIDIISMSALTQGHPSADYSLKLSPY